MMSFERLPKEIQEKVLERQFEEDGEYDNFNANRSAFEWITFGNTPEGHRFWFDVLIYDRHDLFYSLYPKQQVQV